MTVATKLICGPHGQAGNGPTTACAGCPPRLATLASAGIQHTGPSPC